MGFVAMNISGLDFFDSILSSTSYSVFLKKKISLFMEFISDPIKDGGQRKQ
jgi:hypothetical protein